MKMQRRIIRYVLLKGFNVAFKGKRLTKKEQNRGKKKREKRKKKKKYGYPLIFPEETQLSSCLA